MLITSSIVFKALPGHFAKRLFAEGHFSELTLELKECRTTLSSFYYRRRIHKQVFDSAHDRLCLVAMQSWTLFKKLQHSKLALFLALMFALQICTTPTRCLESWTS